MVTPGSLPPMSAGSSAPGRRKQGQIVLRSQLSSRVPGGKDKIVLGNIQSLKSGITYTKAQAGFTGQNCRIERRGMLVRAGGRQL